MKKYSKIKIKLFKILFSDYANAILLENENLENQVENLKKRCLELSNINNRLTQELLNNSNYYHNII